MPRPDRTSNERFHTGRVFNRLGPKLQPVSLISLLLIEEWDKRQQHGELQPTASALRKLPALLLLVIATPSRVMTAELLDDVVILVSEIFTVKCVHGITAFRNFPAPIAASSPAGS